MFLAGGWIGFKNHDISVLEQNITSLDDRIRLVRAHEEVLLKAHQLGKIARQDQGKIIDWRNIAQKIGQISLTAPDVRALGRFQRRLMEMTGDELVAQLDEIAKLDLDKEMREQCKFRVLYMLADKDPELALERCSINLDNDDVLTGNLLACAFGKWTEKDRAAAIAWLDQSIAAGKFDSKSIDGKSQTRLCLERGMICLLLQSDPQAAFDRMKTLPEEQQEDQIRFLSFGPGGIIPESEAAYAKLARVVLPTDKAVKILALAAGRLVEQGSYERVNGFISRTGPSDDEKMAIISEVMECQIMTNGHVMNGIFNGDALEKARAWAATQSPGMVEQATGQALAQTLWRGSFGNVSARVLQYQESSGKDDVLVAFLKDVADQNNVTDLAKPLIDKIKDPALQQQIRDLPAFK